jgi:hypothetical protein
MKYGEIMNILTKCRVNRALAVFCFLLSVSVSTIGRENRSVTNDEHDDEIRQLISKLESSSIEERRNAIVSLHRFGKEAIPFLIENVSNQKQTYGWLCSIINSDLRLAIAAKTYAGTLSSYVIELVLRRDRIILDKNDHPQFLLGNNQDNYIFWEGVIKKKNGLAKKTDLLPIQKLYQKWWDKNKSETIEILREKQKSGERVLDRKPYYWE